MRSSSFKISLEIRLISDPVSNNAVATPQSGNTTTIMGLPMSFPEDPQNTDEFTVLVRTVFALICEGRWGAEMGGGSALRGLVCTALNSLGGRNDLR